MAKLCFGKLILITVWSIEHGDPEPNLLTRLETDGDRPDEMWLILNGSHGDEERPGDLGYAINTFADVVL